MIKSKRVNKFLLSIAIVLIVMMKRSDAQNTFVPKDYQPISHPRLLLLKGEEDAIIKSCMEEGLKSKVKAAIINESYNMLSKTPIEHKLEGRRLLTQSREFLKRIFFLSFAYRVTADTRYAERAEKEMLTVAAFNDWNPSHYLDVAEMTTGMAIGYDWLYQYLSPNSRNTIAASIITLGLTPSLNEKKMSWLTSTNNWNQVCNTGMALGALAVYETNPELANRIVNRSIEAIKIPMKEYGPDGAYPEGPGYWQYGTSYNTLFLTAIEKAFGSDYGLSQIKGFLQSGYFMLNMASTRGESFNYSDAGNSVESVTPAIYWFKNKTSDNSILYSQQIFLKAAKPSDLAKDRFLPALLIWAKDVQFSKITIPANHLWVGQGPTPVAFMRTSWDNPNALYVGLKGGSPSTNHAHMDVGSFVMDNLGERWAMDLGMEDYTAIEAQKIDLFNNKQNSARWQVFRHNNYHHNTLTIDGALQNVNGTASIISSNDSPDSVSATTDITSLYTPALSSAIRTVAIVNHVKAVVKDCIINTDKVTKVRWTMVTPANVTIVDEHTIELSQHHKKVWLKLNYRGKAIPFSTPATPPTSYEKRNEGIQLTGFDFELTPNEQVEWQVTFSATEK